MIEGLLKGSRLKSALVSRTEIAFAPFNRDLMRFRFYAQEDPTTRKWLQQLLITVGVARVPTMQGGGGFDHMLMN